MDLISVTLCVAAAAIVLGLWIKDLRAWKNGTPFERSLQGATTAPASLVKLSVLVSLGFVLLQTAGDYALGVAAKQSAVPFHFIFPMLGATIVETLIFQGYLVVQSKGRKALIGSIVFFSIAAATIHGHMVGKAPDGNGFKIFIAKGPLWWTTIVLAQSLWWYAVRFMPTNKDRSLVPCFAGRVASCAALFAIWLAQGLVTL